MTTPHRTPLPEADRSAAAAFWQRYLASTDEEDSGDYSDTACVGDSVELADELIDLVLRGLKRATAGSLAGYEIEGVAPTEVGDRWVACDWPGASVGGDRTTEVRAGSLSSVDEQLAERQQGDGHSFNTSSQTLTERESAASGSMEPCVLRRVAVFALVVLVLAA